jgi:hypothetical protein
MTDKRYPFGRCHYDWLHENLEDFLRRLCIPNPDWYLGLISAHGDKFGSYKLHGATIPHEHGVAIYLLTYVLPWSKEVRDTEKGWVDPIRWVFDNYERFKPTLPPAYPIGWKEPCYGCRAELGTYETDVIRHTCGR